MSVSPERRHLRLTGARIRTLDAARPDARTITLARGVVAGFDDAGDTRSVALDGATVIPGLIDAHLHLALGGESLLELDLSGVRSRAEFEAAIARRHRELPPGRWLRARGWNEDAFVADGLPDRAWLTAAGDRPVVAWRMDHHSCVVNDAVLAHLGSALSTTDPPGGRIDRDAAGSPTGMMREAAAWQLVLPLLPPLTIEDERAAVRAAHRLLARLGLVAVGSMEYRSTLERAILPERDALLVRMAVTLLDRSWPLPEGLLDFARAFANDEFLRVVGCKAFVDGTLGSRTARMLEDYADDPGNRGLLVELAEEGHLVAWIRAVRAAGLSPAMHAIGDEAARLALDAIEASDGPGMPIARVEHAQTLDPRDIPRFAGRIASMQPLHKAYDARSAATRLGAARMDRFFAFRALVDAGAILAFGSDWPIVSPDPIAGMAAAITGRDLDGRVVRGEENLSPAEALAAYTAGAARCLGLEGHGALRLGGPADLVVLDRDPLATDWDRERPRVLATIVGGRATFVADDGPAALRE